MRKYFQVKDTTFQQLLEKMEHLHSFFLLPRQQIPVQGIYDVPGIRRSFLKFLTENSITISYMFSVAGEPTQGNFFQWYWISIIAALIYHGGNSKIYTTARFHLNFSTSGIKLLITSSPLLAGLDEGLEHPWNLFQKITEQNFVLYFYCFLSS